MRETRSRRFPIHLNLQIDTGNSRGEIVDRRVFDRRGSGWSNGAAFCPRLPAALTASGIYLPQERAEQHKDQRAESEEAASKQRSARVVPIVIFGFLTLGALQFFYRLINGQDLGSKTVGSSTDQLQLTTTMVGLSMSAIIAAGCGLRVMHAFLDWPDPTNRGTLLSVWLVVLSGGVIVLLARRKTGTGTTT